MALKLLQPGLNPLGQFDGYDFGGQYLSIKGGEVMQFASVPSPSNSGTDLAAADVFRDGYAASGLKRTVVALAGSTATAVAAPYMLADDGVFGYGTLFGSVVGGVAGQVGTTAYGVAPSAPLGPSTATGSGKVTCWDKPGLYAVSLDAVAASLQPGTATTISPGDQLSFTSGTGLLRTAGGTADGVATFVSYETNGSLVTTPNSLVAALNSPTGATAQLGSFQFVVVHFNPYP